MYHRKTLVCTQEDKELIFAVKSNDLRKVTELLSAGGNANTCDTDCSQDTLLHFARSAEVVRVLLLHGADVNAYNDFGETALHTAVTHSGSLEVIQELLKHGACINQRSGDGNTALSLAVKKKFFNRRVIRELLKYGADVNISVRERGLSPLGYAVRYDGFYDFLIKYSLLYKNGANRQIMYDCPASNAPHNYSAVMKCSDACITEISKMETTILGNISLYELVTTEDEQLRAALYPDNELPDFANAYPMYSEVILEKLPLCFKRGELLSALKETEIYTNYLSSEGVLIKKSLNFDAVTIVANYLTNNDILNLLAAFKNSGKTYLRLRSGDEVS